MFHCFENWIKIRHAMNPHSAFYEYDWRFPMNPSDTLVGNFASGCFWLGTY